MTINVAAMPDQVSDIRTLTDAEIDDVNGGFIIALALATGFFLGMAIGATIHYCYYEGR
jgi:hypothetical protein